MKLTTRTWWTLLAILIFFTLVRVATTHRVFSQTADEPWHLIAGYDALTKWSLNVDLHHPPLARVFFALPFIRTPEPPPGAGDERGNALLLRNERYTQNLARARAGNLLFLGLAILAVAIWTRHLFSPAIALVAALLFASLPPILAHGGLATTDMAITAMLPLALYAFTLFLEQATWKRTLLLGLAIAGALLAKYSFLPYFACLAPAIMLVRRRLPSPRILVSGALAFVLVWAAYGFTFDTLAHADQRGEGYVKQTLGNPRYAEIRVPAPLYVLGVLEVKKHNMEGHKAYLFGEQRYEGWWYYFPLAIFFKTPIPFLLLAIAGIALMVSARRGLDVVLIVFGLLGVAMTAHINIGIRHVLPIYVPLSICAAYAAVELWRFRIAVIALVGWLVVGSMLAHPDYLPWFNAFAGDRPERILNDSNIDWGQDTLRLVRYARQQKLPHLTVSIAGTTPLDKIGLPPITMLEAWKPLYGWVAVSEFQLAQGRGHSPELRAWVDEWFPEDRPFKRIGTSIRLYHFAEKP